MSETWKSISGRPGYEVSDLGKVRWKNRILNPSADHKGYLRASFWTENGSRKKYIHTIVAAEFIGKRPDGAVIRHINGIKTDCRAENLAYGTRSQNEADKALHGTAVIGQRHHSNKLTDQQVLQIRKRYMARDTQNGMRAMAQEFGVSAKTIEAIIKRKTWRHSP